MLHIRGIERNWLLCPHQPRIDLLDIVMRVRIYSPRLLPSDYQGNQPKLISALLFNQMVVRRPVPVTKLRALQSLKVWERVTRD